MISQDLAILYFFNGLPKEIHFFAELLSDSAYLMAILILFLHFRKNKLNGITATFSIVFATALSVIFKHIFQSPRPFLSVGELNISDSSSGYSFPSSHTTLAFAAAETKPDYVFLFRIWAVLIGLSRIVLGQHYITDVIAGAILGIIVSRFICKHDILRVLKKIKSNQFELKRQLFHMATGVIVAGSIYFLEKKIVLILFSSIIIIGLILSHVSKTRKIPIIDWILDKFEREKDSKKFPGKGAFFFMLGSLISILLYGSNIAFVAVLILAVGDAATTMGGKIFGRTKHIHSKRKTLEGSIVGMSATFIVLLFLITLNPLNAFIVSVAFGVVESIIYRINDYEIDDNFVIPIVCGFILCIL
ncbi:phosphatase PAP2 family protein [archaeon]|nr:phosphatase PAP2 family protein [archaeon]